MCIFIWMIVVLYKEFFINWNRTIKKSYTICFKKNLIIFLFELFDFLMKIIQLIKMLLSLLLECLNLFLFISELHLQTLILIMSIINVFLKFSNSDLKLLLLTL